MKPGFEDAYSVFGGVRFADAESRCHALWALYWAARARDVWYNGPAFRPPLVLITGPKAIGKATLARRLHGGTNPPMATADQITPVNMKRVVEQTPPVMIWHSVRKLTSLQDQMLCHFIRSGRVDFLGRDCDQRHKRTHVLKTLMIMTGPEELKLSHELARLSVRIRLATKGAKE